jgi:aspartate aminotransferase-like enzyme
VQLETKAYGFERARLEQIRLGEAVRRLLARTGFKSVAARDFAAPGVVVSYTSDPEMKSGAKFAALGLQIAAGVPLMLDDFTTSSPDFITFRLGLFGIDKLSKMQETIARLEKALVALTFRDGAPTSRF